MRLKQVISLVASVCILHALVPVALGGKLSDLVRKPAQLYLPTQLLAGKPALFTISAKPGQSFRIILSSYPLGLQSVTGNSLRVGKPTVEQSGVIPEGGVVETALPIPENTDSLGGKQFVEALIWSSPDQADVQSALLINSDGSSTANNMLVIGTEADPGGTLLIPGDPAIGNIIRSVSQMQATHGDTRKQQLIDDGNINRNREIDRNLNSIPSPY